MNQSLLISLKKDLLQALVNLGIIQARMDSTVDTLLPWENKVGSVDNRHNVRVLCDLAGLNLHDKDVITACIEQESDFWPGAIGKPNFDGTRDWGIAQYNDGKLRGVPLWIGEGAYFKNTDEVLNNPQKCIEEMIAQYKLGHISWWSSFKTGAYLKFMPV